MARNFPFQMFLFACFPTISLLAANLGEINPQTAIRPILVSILCAILLAGLLWVILRDWRMVGVIGSLVLLLFFSYGQVYQVLKPVVAFGTNLGRHRFLIPFYGLLVGGLTSLYFRKREWYKSAAPFFTLTGALLLILPLVSILFNWRTFSDEGGEDLLQTIIQHPLQANQNEELPDIYYIILDGYTRADVLANELGFDNSAFIEQLEQLDFYVADRSQANYTSTQPSITTALNMAYVPELESWAASLGLGDSWWVFLKHSLVRAQLEALGYTTVGFETEYEWSRVSDADIYLSLATNPLTLQRITPFESLLVKSTAIKILLDSQYKLLISNLEPIEHPHDGHIEIQRFILDQIPKLADLPEPTFTFAHLLIPHVPYVFGPDGEIRTDPGFFGTDLAGPINNEYLIEGYTGQIQFINTQILGIVERILQASSTQPIIILQGDHGLQGGSKEKILNAYLVSEEVQNQLYPTISPVNSFRIIFDGYFNSDYGLLPDELLELSSPDS